MSDWDAERYHRVSDPQWSWGLRVLERLKPATGEWILDIGCGTGRLTAEIRDRTPSLRLVGVDRSASMLDEAARTSMGAGAFVQADAVRLPFRPVFDAVFSTATLHWVPDHPALFAEIYRVLRPGGRLAAQAGGRQNLARLYERAAAFVRAPELSSHFDGWLDPWNFAAVDETRARLEHAGFSQIHVGLESTPTTFAGAPAFSEFVATVCVRDHLDRLPAEKRRDLMNRLTELAAGDDPPFTLDYWRLNIDARKE